MVRKVITLFIFFIFICINSGLSAQAGKKAAKKTAKEPEVKEVQTPVPDDKYKWNIYFRINQGTISSATALNALKMDDTSYTNRVMSRRMIFISPKAGEFKGQSFDFGFGIRHSWLFKSNWLFSFGNYADTSSSSLYFENGLKYISSGPYPSNYYGYTYLYEYPFTANTLQTGRISYAAEFFPWAKSGGKLSKFGFRFGPELYVNEVRMKSDYLLNSNPSAFDFMNSREIKNNEGFGNLFIGMNYSYEINQKNKIDFGLEVFKSVAATGTYRDVGFTYVYSVYQASSVNFPYKGPGSGTFSTDLTGARLNLGYMYQWFERTGVRISGGYWYAVHDITKSNIKTNSSLADGIVSLITSNPLGFLFSNMSGMSPNPSSTDKRVQIGLEVVFRF